MGSRSVWKGFISFGILQFAVKAYTGARDKRIELHTYHVACGGPVKKPNHCPKCNVDLQEGEIYKGFVNANGTVTPLTTDEIKAITPATEHAMEISQCVSAAEIDQFYFAESFYLLPDVGGNKAYSLLAQTLKQTKTVALAQLCKNNREHIAMIRPKGNGLAMHFMFYADEVAEVPEFENFKSVEVSPLELKLAGQLVESLTESFQPDQFEDGYRGRLNTLIASKIDKSVAAPEPVKAAKSVATVDIAQALQASLANRKRKEPAPAPAAKGKKGKKVA